MNSLSFVLSWRHYSVCIDIVAYTEVDFSLDA